MVKQLQRWKVQLIAFLAAVLAVATLPALVQPGAAATTIDFVTPQWVAQHSRDGNLRILDVRANPLDYINGHIPGAVNIAENTFRGPNGRLPVQFWEQQKIESLFKESGVNNNSHVVIYSDGNSILGSTQVAYLLERSGHGGRVSVLDGGFKAYKDAMKHVLGYPNVRLYKGSWTEYSAQPDLPIATGRDPNV